MQGDGGPVDDVRVVVAARLRARRAELAQAIFVRVSGAAFAPPGGSGSSGAQDAEYVAGLRATVAAAVEHGLRGIEHGEGRAGPVPVVAIEQARRAARAGVSLDTMLRRYVVGHTLLGEYVMEEADRGDFPSERGALRGALRAQASVLDRLIAEVGRAYDEELERVYDGAPALPALLSNPSARRARECLLFLAAHSDASNRELRRWNRR